MCASVCTRKAISMHLDEEGFYRPSVDEALCNHCGLCTMACYKFDNGVKMTSDDQLSEKPLYVAWSNGR